MSWGSFFLAGFFILSELIDTLLLRLYGSQGTAGDLKIGNLCLIVSSQLGT